jgi:hypothetical protein
MCDKEALLKK